MLKEFENVETDANAKKILKTFSLTVGRVSDSKYPAHVPRPCNLCKEIMPDPGGGQKCCKPCAIKMAKSQQKRYHQKFPKIDPQNKFGCIYLATIYDNYDLPRFHKIGGTGRAKTPEVRIAELFKMVNSPLLGWEPTIRATHLYLIDDYKNVERDIHKLYEDCKVQIPRYKEFYFLTSSQVENFPYTIKAKGGVLYIPEEEEEEEEDETIQENTTT